MFTSCTRHLAVVRRLTLKARIIFVSSVLPAFPLFDTYHLLQNASNYS